MGSKKLLKETLEAFEQHKDKLISRPELHAQIKRICDKWDIETTILDDLIDKSVKHLKDKFLLELGV